MRLVFCISLVTLAKINHEGMQEEAYKLIDWDEKPIKTIKIRKGQDLILDISVQGEKLYFKSWVINVGKIKLYLLDTDLPQNTPLFQSITNMLYEADKDKRILQEILLAYGSMKLMEYLDIKPSVYHMNEGHSAFIIFELLRKLIQDENFSFAQAKNIIKAKSVFTTHTPVVEGNEHFDKKLISKYLKDKINEIGVDYEEIMAYGSIEGDVDNFWLPALAIRFSKFINGVSKLHSDVSRKMWHKIYPSLTDSEMPIRAITNGVHLQTWLSKQLTSLYDRYVGPEYLHTLERKHVWNNVLLIPDNEIWEAHVQRKEQAITFIRNRYFEFSKQRGDVLKLLNNNKIILNHNALTFGFARRFAQYKRATLLLKNPERLLRILNHSERPVQFIFAGKAHPADIEGKKLIKQIIDFAKHNNVEDKFLFIEDYDMNVARHIVQGVDVWLNNPVKPMEASGTSGMKAGLNGVLNFSVLDGWWPECYDGKNGWMINAADYYNDYETAQYMEAQQIYDIIENEIAPLFFERDSADYPVRWIQMMKRSMYTVGMGFNMHRMLDEYAKKFYIPSIYLYERIAKEKYKALDEMIEVEQKVAGIWDKVYIKDFFLKYPNNRKIISGDIINVEAYVFLDDADNKLFEVELYYQYLGEERYEAIALDYVEKYKDNVVKYTCAFRLKGSGDLNISVRIKPKYTMNLFKERKLIKWVKS